MKKKIDWKKVGIYALYYFTLFAAMFGFLMVFGGIGNIECADEMHKTLTKAEEMQSYLTSFLGFPVMIIFGKIAMTISKVAGIGDSDDEC